MSARRTLSTAWTIADLVGWSLGWAVGGLGGERLGGFYSFIAAAALSSVFEWLVLRRTVPKAHKWLAPSALGIVLGATLSIAVRFPVGVLLLILGQWTFFIRAYRHHVYWLLGGIAGAMAGGAVSTSAYLALGGQVGSSLEGGSSGPLLGLLLGALFGLVFGAIRALALVRILGPTTEPRAG